MAAGKTMRRARKQTMERMVGILKPAAADSKPKMPVHLEKPGGQKRRKFLNVQVTVPSRAQKFQELADE